MDSSQLLCAPEDVPLLTGQLEGLKMAFQVAHEGNCLRRRVGCAVRVTGLNKLKAVGYQEEVIWVSGANRSLNGQPSCEGEGKCLIAHFDGRQRCVRTLHAEVHTVIRAMRTGVSLVDGEAFCTTKPCLECAKVLYQAGVNQCTFYDVNEGIEPRYETTLLSGIRLVRAHDLVVAEIDRLGLNDAILTESQKKAK